MSTAAVAAAAVVPAVPAYADNLTPGKYSVTVTSTYQNPDTGLIDDVGQNPAIGNTMVQAQVQTVGYVEIMEDGTIYLNTRWNQADANIYANFETSSDNSQSWTNREFEVTNQMEAGTYEFAGNTFEATVTDYRLQLGSLNDTIRCKNYVEAMARECIWFCYISSISDFDESAWTNVQAPSISADTMNEVANTYAAQQSGSGSTSSSASGSSSTASSGSTGTVTGNSSTSTITSNTTVDGLKDRTVAEAKTADELLEEADGINDAETSSDGDAATAAVAALNGDSDTESVSADTSKIVIAAILGVVVGAAVVGIAAYMMARKKRSYQDLFADVDDGRGASDKGKKKGKDDKSTKPEKSEIHEKK